MGDALMQVLDIAEKIQTDDARDPRRQRRPRAQRHPLPRRPRAPAAAPSVPTDQPSGQPLVAAILLSDGANSVGKAEPLDAAQRAKTLGVPIYTIALGTPNGPGHRPGPVRTGRRPSTCRPTPRRCQADRIDHRRQGRSTPRRPKDLASVYDNLQSRIGYTEERQEVTFALVGAGLLLVVLGAGLSAVWFGRLP